MARAIVKKNMGRKFVVALVGHDRGMGEAEFIVHLPSGPISANDAAQRHAVLTRALKLNDEFAASLRTALATPNASSNDHQ
jgi:hypothetical protein